MVTGVNVAENRVLNVPCQIADGVAKNFIKERDNMREIKFRALLKDGGGWRYGVFPYVAPEMSNTIYPMFKFWQQLRSLYQRHTLTQFTGLKDKSGKEIYEADIVTYGTEDDVINAIVGFGEEESETSMLLTGFQLIVMSSADYEDGDDNDHALEVIGNIYENPELLKGGEKCST